MGKRRVALMALMVLLFSALLTACSESTPAEKPPEALVIETEVYRLTLPPEWKESVEVSYMADSKVFVHYADYTDLGIFTVSLTDSPFSSGGDIGAGRIFQTEAPDGRRLEVRAVNYPYRFWYDMSTYCTPQDRTYAHLTDSQKVEIMKLETGEEIDLLELYSAKTEQECEARLLYFDHLKSLFEQALEFI